MVKCVLKKIETTALTINKAHLQIGEHHPEIDESKDEEMDTAVKVTNLPPKISKEEIELAFESHIKSGGSEEVKKVKYDEAARYAIVWFKDPEG